MLPSSDERVNPQLLRESCDPVALACAKDGIDEGGLPVPTLGTNITEIEFTVSTRKILQAREGGSYGTPRRNER